MDYKKVVEICTSCGADFNGGTGYLIRDDLILTAYHVISCSIEALYDIRFLGDINTGNFRWRNSAANLCWYDSKNDLALLKIQEAEKPSFLTDITENKYNIQFGELDGATLPAKGYGFPKVQKIQGRPNPEPLEGNLSRIAGIREQRLRLQVTSPIPESPEEWTGISGTALFVDQCLVGVIVETSQEQFRQQVLWATPISVIATNKEFCELILDDRNSQITLQNVEQINSPPKINSPRNILRSGLVKFVGREKVLKTLHQQLKETDQVAITGMGGVGKTELAIQYALKYWEQTYPGGVFWLQARASDIGEQIRDFAELQMNLVVPEELKRRMSIQDQQAKSQAGKQVAEWFWQKWQPPKTQPALVIVDDVTNYNQVRGYLPPVGLHFKVLITTRLQLDKPFQQIFLEVLEAEPTVELLGEWIGQEKINQQLADAQKLSGRLGYLPLALNLVGRYVSKRKITLAEMLNRLEKELIKNKALEVEKNKDSLTLDIERGVAAAFELSWEVLSDEAKELGYLLSLLPFIPYRWELVENSISALASIPWQLVKQNTEDIEDARVELEELHLVQGQETYRLHPLIRYFFRDKLEQYPGGDDVKRIIGMIDPDPNRAILPANFGILPTVNEFVGYPGCYVACYSHTKEGSQYSVGSDIYVMGQVRVQGRYERRICKPEGYENADISASPEFKELCARNLPNVCQDDSCWAGGDTGGWFGIPE